MIEREFLLEARQILAGQTCRLVELAHLEALEEHYQSQIIKICHDMDKLTTAARARN